MLTVVAEWKLRIGSPRELFWELHQFLRREGFTCREPFKPLSLKSTPIEGHATFNDSIDGWYNTPRNTAWKLVLGIFLCLTIILLPLGLWLIKESEYNLIEKISFCLEGETFRASAYGFQEHRSQSEVTDTVSNARVTLQTDVLLCRSDGKKTKPPSQVDDDEFEVKVGRVEKALSNLIPRIRLPDVTDSRE